MRTVRVCACVCTGYHHAVSAVICVREQFIIIIQIMNNKFCLISVIMMMMMWLEYGMNAHSVLQPDTIFMYRTCAHGWLRMWTMVDVRENMNIPAISN